MLAISMKQDLSHFDQTHAGSVAIVPKKINKHQCSSIYGLHCEFVCMVDYMSPY